MGYVPYVSFATYHCATVNICLYFKRLMFMQIFCKKKKKKKGSSQFCNVKQSNDLFSFNHMTSNTPIQCIHPKMGKFQVPEFHYRPSIFSIIMTLKIWPRSLNCIATKELLGHAIYIFYPNRLTY